ncbi:MAG: nucleoside hydrolase [Nitrososphaerota archaeon]|jgi:inosine-uridine nucleoside N-ribohydrolase|nr:nucleoside hydrolase [Nitrososphaerota archaeon]
MYYEFASKHFHKSSQVPRNLNKKELAYDGWRGAGKGLSSRVRRMFLDMDPGIDDAVAMLLASQLKDVEVLGVSTVAGNVDVVKTTRNALKIVEFLGLRAGVYRGSSRPLIRPHENSADIHGNDGLGGVALPEPRIRADPLPGPMAMAEFARAEPGKVTLVATGPLTNVAIACMLDMDFPGHVKQLVIMGGAFSLAPYGKGNVSQFAEYNIYADPEAANLVFTSFQDILCVGLDVTMHPDLLVKQEDLNRLRKSGSRMGSLAADIMGFSVRRMGYFAPHDPLAVYCVHDQAIVSTKRGRVKVVTDLQGERGRTILETDSEKSNVSVASAVDGTRFKEELLGALERAR